MSPCVNFTLLRVSVRKNKQDYIKSYFKLTFNLSFRFTDMLEENK